ncbi:uncharacterized protein Dwil_GK24618 [Drosophila willistoni]|uniref:WW domain-binding protein 4 n=1 Tax=Drosophila willistoni TaxID=7260 RepID=B4N0Q2_DROWI|nr:WW domain-binding protein 4 [Drosophila willistoni]EDW77665.1 uncharacterized protein Dwil_GK24618 [Drosophila willistoni]
MTEYWKSNERKYCDFCKCWISDNKASVAFHESGKRHKLNVAKRITDISRNSEKSERERQKMDADIRKMEEAAMKSYAQDIHNRSDMTARSINTVINASTSTSGITSSSTGYRMQRQVDPMRLVGDSDDEDGDESRRVGITKVTESVVPDASLWVEGKSDEGHTYYWNVKTNESVWEPPKEGYLSYEEYERINQLALHQQELSQEQESLKFRANADEEVARVNRERLKAFRKPEAAKEKKQKEEKRQTFKTEEEAATNEIGQWQTVVVKPPEKPIDWELPNYDNYKPAPVVPQPANDAEPPVKRFKERTVTALAADEDEAHSGSSSSTMFKKRKFGNKGNARKRLDD